MKKEPLLRMVTKNFCFYYIYCSTVILLKSKNYHCFFFLNQNAEVKQKLGASEKEKEVCCLEKMHHRFINPLTPGPFLPKTHFLDIFGIFCLDQDVSQISFNLLKKKAFATWQLTFLPPSITFYDIFARACAEIQIFRTRKWPTSLGFSVFFNFYSPFLCRVFLSFSGSE